MFHLRYFNKSSYIPSSVEVNSNWFIPNIKNVWRFRFAWMNSVQIDLFPSLAERWSKGNDAIQHSLHFSQPNGRCLRHSLWNVQGRATMSYFTAGSKPPKCTFHLFAKLISTSSNEQLIECLAVSDNLNSNLLKSPVLMHLKELFRYNNNCRFINSFLAQKSSWWQILWQSLQTQFSECGWRQGTAVCFPKVFVRDLIHASSVRN